MVALPDFEPAFFVPPRPENAPFEWSVQAGGLARIGLRLAGAGLAAASFGLWMLPAHAADPAMMLVRLVFSIGLFAAGTVCLLAARRAALSPEVRIDHATRELRVLSRGPGGTRQVAAHRLDDLHELALRDGLLSARNASGRLVVSLDVEGARASALRKALARAP